jgi:hypothetical protein
MRRRRRRGAAGAGQAGRGDQGGQREPPGERESALAKDAGRVHEEGAVSLP